MTFIVDTGEFEVSKSMIEVLLENELDHPVVVKELDPLDDTSLCPFTERVPSCEMIRTILKEACFIWSSSSTVITPDKMVEHIKKKLNEKQVQDY